MMEEAMPVAMRLLGYLKRFDTPEMRAMAEKPGAQLDMITGEGDCTVDEELSDRAGGRIIYPLHDVRNVAPHDNDSVFALNERYLDVMSPSHLMRGLLCVPGAAFLWLAATMFFTFLGDLVAGLQGSSLTFGKIMLLATFLPISGFFTWLFWHALVSFDWFHYRANPIRFDRERRMVHVWCSRRAGGCYSVPWDDNLVLVWGGKDSEGYPLPPGVTFFSIDPETRRIKRRIAVGKRALDEVRAQAFLEYICRFMEQGRAAVPTPRRWALMTPSLAYSFNAWFKFRDIAEQRRKGEWTIVDWVITLVLAPMHLALALSHFIAMLTSRTPKWPAEMR